MHNKNSKSAGKWILSQIGKLKWLCLALIICNAVISSFGVIVALLSKWLIDSAVSANKHVFLYCAIAFGVLVVVLLIFKNIYLHLEFYIQTKLDMQLKKRMLHKLMKKNYEEVGNYHSGELLNRMTDDVQVICSGITSIAPAVAGSVVRLVAAFGVLVYLQPLFAVVFAVAGVLVYVGSIWMKRIIKRLHKEVQSANGTVRGFLQEAITNLLPIKVFEIEPVMEQRCETLLEHFFRVRMKRRTAGIVANSVLGFIFDAGYLFAMVYSGIGLLQQTISFGTLTAMLQLVGQVQNPFQSLASAMPRYFEMLGSAERIMELEALPEEPKQEPYDGNMAQLQFQHVTFGYGEAPVLSDFSFTMERGDKCLISGPSGIGKSTLMKLLLGVYEVQSGNIHIIDADGRHIEAGKCTRNLFSYVPQGNLLLSGTLYENLTLVKPDATEEQIWQALQISQAKEFVEKLPDGLYTKLGENGYGLSQGQAQRIAIARAILADKQVLLLDEATSALDGETEQRLLEAISKMEHKTCIMITHRMAAAKICNRQVELE